MKNDFITEDYGKLPNQVRVDQRLELGARLLYVEIYAKSTQRGYCYASNKNMGTSLGVDERTIQRWLRSLEKLEYVKSKQFTGKVRHIFPCNPLPNYTPDTIVATVKNSTPDICVTPDKDVIGTPDTSVTLPPTQMSYTPDTSVTIIRQGERKVNKTSLNNTMEKEQVEAIKSDLPVDTSFRDRYSEKAVEGLKPKEKHYLIDKNNLTETQSKQMADKYSEARIQILKLINDELKKTGIQVECLSDELEVRIEELVFTNYGWREILVAESKLIDGYIQLKKDDAVVHIK